MKKFLLTVSVIILSVISGCGVGTKLPDKPIVFDVGSNGEYVYLSYEGKTYVPYCPYARKYLGDCIGYYDSLEDEYSSSTRVYIYEFKGYSSDEWIVDYLPTINEGMVLREISTTNIPEGLESEYEWNN